MKVFSPAKQVAFHQLLAGARKTLLADALTNAVRNVDPDTVKSELSALVPNQVQRVLAAAGVRDEWVFPAPCLLKEQPTLIGYYRLLLASRKRSSTGEGLAWDR